MEKIYINLRKINSEVLTVCFTYILATITNVFNNGVHTAQKLFQIFTNLQDLSIFLFWFTLVFLIIYAILYKYSKNSINKTNPENLYAKLMNDFADDCFDNVELFGGFSWGENKTAIFNENLLEGWKTKDIVIEDVDLSFFDFSEVIHEEPLELLQEHYWDYYNNDFQPTLKKGNNNTRWMLTGIQPNFSKTDKKLFLKFKKTDWSQTTFIWKNVMQDKNLKQKKISDFYQSRGVVLPNSFCLHLIIETVDNEVVLAKISNHKGNDYPNRYAATIGEQLEQVDLFDDLDYKHNFVLCWVKRAMKEEFSFDENDFKILVNEDSIRILSVDVEGDIYNFSLLCTLRLTCSFDELYNHSSLRPFQSSEISELIKLDIDKIPDLLVNYSKNKDKYHPSTYLRLLLFYIHKKGSKRAAKKILETDAFKNT